MNLIKNCPICEHSDFEDFIRCKDFTVSMEEFTIVECCHCGFHFTNPIPEENTIGEYYKSEEYISHSSTNKGLMNKIYHRVRKYTLKRKLKLIKKESSGNNLLDIGSGTGHFLNVCNQGGFKTTGLEPDQAARKFAEVNFGLKTLKIEDLRNLENETFDVITMWHVLEHIYKLREDLNKISAILKKNGVLIVAVPNMNSYDAKKYKEFWAAYDLPIHLYHFLPKDIRLLFLKYNMSIEKILPMKFDAYYVSMLSEKYRGGNMIKAFFTGFKSNMYAKDEFYSSQIYILRKNTL